MKILKIKKLIFFTFLLLSITNSYSNEGSPAVKWCNDDVDVYSYSSCGKCQTRKDRVSVLKNNLAWFDSKTIDNVTTPPKNESRKIKKLLDDKFSDNGKEKFKKAFQNPYFWEYQLTNERSEIRPPSDKYSFTSEPIEYMSIINKLSTLKATYYDYKDARGGFKKDDSYSGVVAFGLIFQTIQDIHRCSLRDKKTITELNKFIKRQSELNSAF